MRLKVDENLPTELADLLRSAGHEADTLADEQASGASDPALAELCKRERRALVTLDRGFADIRAYPPEEYEGIVVLRLVEALRSHPLPGHLWVLEPHRLRLRGPLE